MELYNALIRSSRALYDGVPVRQWDYREDDA